MNHNQHLLYNLTEYSHTDYYPFHMPGHKRALLEFPNPWSIDITEIEGFDNLHHAEGILEELQQETARLFGAEKSFCLVNGSTCGILSAVSACVKPGGKLLMSRNCHKSVYHAVYLRNITPIYVMPEMTEFGIMGSLSPETVKQALKEQPDIDAVLVVSPTYDGVVSDIRSIAEIAHAQGIPLIVDEAHGAHLPFCQNLSALITNSLPTEQPRSVRIHRCFPDSALACGADVVIQSLHKTLPSFTQTALLHLNSSLVEESEIRRFLSIYQSSSPSYLLMASIDQCMQIIQKDGQKLLTGLRINLEDFYKKCSSLKSIQVFREQEKNTPALFDRDDSKILISAAASGMSGQKLYNILLEQYHLQLEMASGHYALALTSLMDRAEGFDRLFAALQQIDRMLSSNSRSDSVRAANMRNTCRELYRIPQQTMTIAEAFEHPSATMLLEDAAGAVSREYIYLYPPGIPLVAPGEVIDTSLIENIQRIKEAGLKPEGLSDFTNTRINVVIF